MVTIDTTIDALRARGDHRFNPVRFRLIEALARRTVVHEGEARRILDARLAQLLEAYGEDLAKGAARKAVAVTEPVLPPRSELAALVDHISQQVLVRGDGPTAPEGQTLNYFRSVWTRLSAERRLTQSLEKVPTNAGPLNSHHLVHQSLTLMRDLSPEYLHRFMSYVDALFWVDQATVQPTRGKST